MKRPIRHLRRRLMPLLLLAAILAVGAALAQTGGGYDLTWSTIDGGGGISAGGGYLLTGTLGQHDAGPALSGGAYSVTGGFWGEAPADAPTDSRLYLPLVIR